MSLARVLALTLLVLLALTAAGGVFLLSPAGLPVVLAQARSYLAENGSTLLTAGESGSLYGGISFDSLTITDDATTIKMSELSTSWSLAGLISRRLQISELLVDRLEISLPPAPANPPPREAISLPQAIQLPVEVELQRARVRELLVHPGTPPGSELPKDDAATPSAPLVFSDLGLSLRYQDALYTLENIELVSPWLSVTKGQLAVGDSRPYPVTASLHTRGEVAPVDFETDLRLFGDLDQLRLSVTGSAAGSELSVQATFSPLTLAPVNAANIRLSSLETRRFSPETPTALLDLTVQLQTGNHPQLDAGRWRVNAELSNIDAGMLNENRLPLKSANAVFEFADPTVQPIDVVSVSDFSASLLATQGEASIAGDGRIDFSERLELAGQALPLILANLAIDRLDLASFTNSALHTNLSGDISLSRDRFSIDLQQTRTELTASGAAGTVIVDALPGRKAAIQVRGMLSKAAISVDQANLVVGQTEFNASGSIQTASPFQVQANARVDSLQPGQWIPQSAAIGPRWRDGQINAQLLVSGPLMPASLLQFELTLDNSRLAGQPLTADVQAAAGFSEHGQITQITGLNAQVDFGRNKLKASGALHQVSEQAARKESAIAFTLNLGDMSALDPRLAGSTSLSGSVRGSTDHPVLDLKGGSRQVRYRPADAEPFMLGSLTVDATVPLAIGIEPDSRGRVDLRARDIRIAGERIVTFDTRIEGSRRAHTINASLNLLGQNTLLAATGSVDPDDPPAWQGTINSIRSDGRIRLRSTGQAQLNATAQSFELSGLTLAISGSGIKRSVARIERLAVALGESARVRILGQLEALPVAQLVSAFRSEPLPPTLNNLRLSSEFDLTGSGLEDLTGSLSAKLNEQGTAENELGLAGRNEARFEFDQGGIDGDVDLTLPSLAFTRRFTGPSWVVGGRASLAGTVGGRLSSPTYQFRLSANDLSLLQPALGWRLDRGRLLADISDRGLTLRTLRLQSGDEGRIQMAGNARILDAGKLPRLPDGTRPVLPLDGRFSLDTDRFVVPIGPGQRLILSGKTQLLAELGRLRWVGSLTADEGLIEIAGSGAPTLPDDVQIVEAEPVGKSPVTAPPPTGEQSQISVETALEINLGSRLRIIGGGVNARLTGQLTLLGNLPANPRAEGLVEIKDGTYQAYSQNLQIRRGDVRFNGPIDNPALNIEAVRPNLPVTAGVSITGLALSPRIDLFSDPAMTDAETLSWLVLGVPINSAQSGAQSLALKEAASRIIGQDDGSVSGGGFSDKLGLDTLGFGFASDTGQAQGVVDSGAPTGLPGAGGQTAATTYQEVVTLGKRLSDRLTVSYEQGVRGLFNLLRIQYEINQRLSLRAQTGSESAVDLLYFWSFD